MGAVESPYPCSVCMHGYDVSADALAQFGEVCFSNTLGGHLNDTGALLELYRASHFMFPEESFLEKQKNWLNIIGLELPCSSFPGTHWNPFDLALQFPYYADLQCLENRRSVQHCNTSNLRILKTSYRPINFDKKDSLRLAVEDFNFCQSIHQKELKHLERWVQESRLDKLTFARQKQAYCFFSAAATLFPPEFSDTRLSWAKNSILATVVDDFYDGGGSREELLNLLEIIEKWDGVSPNDIRSEQVAIIFHALHSTINELGEKAFKWQQRNVTRYIMETWLTLIKSGMQEAEWVEQLQLQISHLQISLIMIHDPELS